MKPINPNGQFKTTNKCCKEMTRYGIERVQGSDRE